MAEKNADKTPVKSAKEQEKAAKKAKQDRIKQQKPKKDGNAFSRAGIAVKKYWKDFVGTIKKIVWPSGKQVIKNSVVVLVTILVIGLVVFGFDQALTLVIQKGSEGIIALGSQSVTDEGETETGDDTTAATDEQTTAADVTEGETAESETAESETAESETAEKETSEEASAESTTEPETSAED